MSVWWIFGEYIFLDGEELFHAVLLSHVPLVNNCAMALNPLLNFIAVFLAPTSSSKTWSCPSCIPLPLQTQHIWSTWFYISTSTWHIGSSCRPHVDTLAAPQDTYQEWRVLGEYAYLVPTWWGSSSLAVLLSLLVHNVWGCATGSNTPMNFVAVPLNFPANSNSSQARSYYRLHSTFSSDTTRPRYLIPCKHVAFLKFQLQSGTLDPLEDLIEMLLLQDFFKNHDYWGRPGTIQWYDNSHFELLQQVLAELIYHGRWYAPSFLPYWGFI